LQVCATIFAMPAGQQRRAPTLRLRRLASELRTLRDGAGLTREEVSDRTRINDATLYRIETAKARPQLRTLVTLLDLYGVSQDDQEELITLLRQAGDQTWLQQFPTELPEPYPTYISFEGEAQALLNYESLFVPGLLQTEDYARAALQRGAPNATAEETQRLVEARMSRQTVLTRDRPLRLWTIIDEAALYRPVGGEDVMRQQLERLASAAEQPHLTLQVIPFSTGAHPGMMGAFAILEFGDPTASDLVYIESQAGDLFLERDTDLRRFKVLFEHLRAQALPPEASASLVRQIANGKDGKQR
jgi:transcriptional regulator with XRE-family HTH domain